MNPPGADNASDTSPKHPRLNLPPAELRVVHSRDGIWRIFDRLRDKFVALTPEEWVRQHFVEYLIEVLGYPRALMANEVSLMVNTTRRRADTVVYRREDLTPLVIVEYKAPHIEITQKVFDQIARYNLTMGARLLIVSNGMNHYCALISPDGYRFLRSIPEFSALSEL